ncbi:MAG TPA: di-heme oxidoredictase family protein, partial [Anaerolineales bacterium]|nr:di-heme oxidoredictase family protein [Anaerolineales bacterium]
LISARYRSRISPATTGGGLKREPDEPAFSRISAPDSNACAGCHNQPRSGGGGDIVANVFVLAQTLDPITHSDEPEFSNFRNTLGMFGSGAIEMLSREMTADLLTIKTQTLYQAQRTGQPVTAALETKGISFGTITANPDGSVDTANCLGIDHDLVVKPFHQAGRVVSLREFSNSAMNHHHGIQSEERFDLNPEAGIDFDEDGIAHELSIGDITAVAIYQAALGVPGQVLPDDKAGQQMVKDGEQLFSAIGCASCHVPEMKLSSPLFVEPNPYNPPGNWSDQAQSFSFDMTTTGEGPYLEQDGAGAVLRAYTDLKRHNLCDAEINHYCNEQLSQGRPDQQGEPGAFFFLTRKLWDVGNSAPYGHVGDLTTLTEAILVHGGEARTSRDAFVALSADDQEAIVRFLKTLQVLPAGSERVITESQLAAYTKPVSSAVPTSTSPLTWVVTGAFLLITFAVGLYFGRRMKPVTA